ncbi:glycogen debranching enzyme family protein, partial [Candidatus Dependentiae bacterium]|nr:glycogen debranching enzyme family protein [Candidatus Dependentiae bacterium]
MKHPEQAIEKEWLVTNFLGGFASSSIILCNTRRYHGLLNISSSPPYNRYHTVSSIDEEILIDGKSFKLGVNQYPGVFNPVGYNYLQNFQFDLYPLFSYKLDTVYLEKEIFMVPFKNEVIINYRFLNVFEKELTFYFRPYFSIRSIHDLHSTYLDEIKGPRIEKNEFSLEIDWFLHPIRVRSTAGLWKKSFKDLRRVIYKKEAQRGLEFNEDLYSPAYLEFSSKKQKIEFSLRVSAEVISYFDPYQEKQNFINEKNKFMNKAGAVEEVDRILLNDASNFISLKKIDRENFTKTIIAGYPWFEDWGRDTMISIPGLLLETNQTETAYEILKEFSKRIKKGLVPNYFSNYSAPSYNTVDASLWFFIAIWEYYK